MKFPKLFSPINIGKLELPNRIVYFPANSHTAETDGFAGDRTADSYAEYAGGAAALICVEDSMVHLLGRRGPKTLCVYDDRYMPGLRRLAEAIKNGGAKAGVHLNYDSCASIPVAPSAIAVPNPGSVVPRELTIDEIEEIEDSFAEAAWRAKEVGFDLVWVHGAHQHIIDQFLSPLSNYRQDAYGGDHNRRLRFLLEIIRKIKQKVGDDFPLMVSLNGEELERGGETLEDAKQNARRVEAAGVHGISVFLGDLPRHLLAVQDYMPLYSLAPMRHPRGHLVHLAAAVKEVVSIPVMTSGRIITPQQAEQILEQDRADLIGIDKGLWADPEWPKKAKEGREREIRHCISCKLCSFETGTQAEDEAVSCSVNPRFARERETQITPATKVKTVFIAGGGPAGLEAARVAALRGHKVTLYEKDKLGGQINLSCVPPGKSEIKLFLDFEQVQLDILKVKIKNEELTLDTVRRGKPDAVVVATGAYPAWPDFPGSHNENVVTAWQVLDGSIVPKGKVVVLGGRLIGAETAEYLATKGNQVTIVEESAEIARDALKRVIADFLRLSLRLLGAKMLTNTVCEEITQSGVTVNRKGERSSIEANTIVLALGNKSNKELADQLKELDIELHVVGDCAGVGKMFKAIKEGFQAGLVL